MTSRKENQISPFDLLSTILENRNPLQTSSTNKSYNYRDVEKMKTGIAEQVSHFLHLSMGCIIYVIISFVYGWELALIVIVYIPKICMMNILIARVNVQ